MSRTDLKTAQGPGGSDAMPVSPTPDAAGLSRENSAGNDSSQNGMTESGGSFQGDMTGSQSPQNDMTGNDSSFQNNMTESQSPQRGMAGSQSASAGTIQISVVSSLGMVPVEGATVTISYTGEPDNPLSVLTTDISGQTPVVDLPAPPLELSLQPGSEEQPYSEYNIEVTAEGYEPVLVSGSCPCSPYR
jgi:hypothetical protein